MALVFIGVLPGEEFYVYCGTPSSALRMRTRNMTLPRQRRLLSAAKELLVGATTWHDVGPKGGQPAGSWVHVK